MKNSPFPPPGLPQWKPHGFSHRTDAGWRDWWRLTAVSYTHLGILIRLFFRAVLRGHARLSKGGRMDAEDCTTESAAGGRTQAGRIQSPEETETGG